MIPPPGFEEIQRQELARLFGMFTVARLALAPLLLALLGWAALVDRTAWRVGLLGAVVPLLLLFFVHELRRYRTAGMSRHALDRNLAVGVAGILTVSAATGGIASPLLPVTILVTVSTGLFVTPALATWLMLVEVAAIWAFAGAALSGRVEGLRFAAFGASPGDPARTLATAAALSLLLPAARYGGRYVRRAFDAVLRRTVRAQSESLEAHAERAEELTALSAEIAHELKNPLASVKGLGGLLAQALPDGKAAERLAVLRREVDRMQSILDEFLNFSRPLVPLALGRHDVGVICQEVAALHEGLASERGVALEVQAGAVAARCDPRKVKQVIINLVQNALDAAPAGTAVLVAAAAAGDGGAQVEISDRGPGLDPALGGQVFDPGITTKPRGSGLGLTIARALARQHGGDLTLGPRPGGGTVARVLLPGAPDAAGPGAA